MSGSEHLQLGQGLDWDPDQNFALRQPSLPFSPRRESAPGGLRSAFGQLRRIFSPGPVKTFNSADEVKGSRGLSLLYEPSEPRVEFVFVHGLGGGSRKTWSSSEDPDTFWPKEWLPYELGFKNARIYSFGYDADWSSQKSSSLTVHDFGQALLADLSNSPYLKKNLHTPIVLVAHSMGGLVVKKAYLLATRDPLYKGIASRIHSLYFLATPHRGADSAHLLSNLLSLKGSKAFVKDLVPGSGSLQAINDEFRHVCNDVQLWSFFEGVPTSGGPSSMTIVDKESAVLDLPGERKRYLAADHRHICKYTTPTDSNYITLRDCFKTTIDELERDFATQRHEDYRSQMKLISNAFDNAKRPEADLSGILDKRQDGSCLWLTEHRHFHLWLEDKGQGDIEPDHCPRALWLNGQPGTGKSVLAGHVIKYLEAYNSIDCAYFFFKQSSKQTLTQLLLSLALQMAETNFEVRNTFLTMIEDGEGLNSQDHTVVWNSLFLGRLLKIKFVQPQFWVIDALDECPSRQLAALVQIFAKVKCTTPLKILFTSRPSDQIERLLDQEGLGRLELHTGQRESLRDISTYVRSKMSRTASQGHEGHSENNDIMREILDKSNGVFLWASLIVSRLEDAHTVESMREVLSQVPSEMNRLYQRILESVEQSSSASLAHCILKWVVCSPQPLSTEQLKEAVRLDVHQTLRASDRIPHICGNLVTVDSASRVQLMHRTVKDFLTTSKSDKYINRHQAHVQLASRCLERLNDLEFAPQRPRRHAVSAPATTSTFDDYAFAHFSYHLAHCSTSTSEADLLSLLASFMNGNFLTWIERTARGGRLSPFKKAIESLRVYLDRYANDHSPLETEHQMVSELVDDFARILAIFGPNLVNTPSSIYGLIPIICPSASLFHRKFGNQTRQRLISSFNEFWDERLSCRLFPARALCVTCNDRYFAVGLVNGTIQMHRASTFERVATLQHGEPVRRLALSTISNILVSSSPKKLVLWDSQQTLSWTTSLSVLPLSLDFSSDESKIFVAVRTGVVLIYQTKDGMQLDSISILDDSSDSDDSENSTRIRKGVAAELVRLCPELDIMGVAFRCSHLELRSIESDERIGIFEKKGYEGQKVAPQILDIAFCPLKDLNLAAAAYQDGEIVTFGTFTLQQRTVYPIYCQILASSPDGRILCAGDNDGVIWLFAFDTLRPMYRISTLEEHITGIVFASNSTRFFDIRGNVCNVWEPSVLIHVNLTDDGSSEAEEHNLPLQEARYTRHFEDGKSITVITQAGNSNYLFCGREDGTITYHDLRSGRQLEELRYHARTVEIQHLDWYAKTQTLFSVDASGRCVATRFSASPSGQLEKVGHIFDHRAASAVKQAVVNADASAFLISTKNGEELWNADSGFAISTNSGPGAQWLIHPKDASQLLLLEGDMVNLFLWKNLKRLTDDNCKSIKLPIGWPAPSPSCVWFYRHGASNISTIDRDPTTGAAKIFSLDVSSSHEPLTQFQMACTVVQSMPEIKVLLGVHRSDLYFLTRQGWMCSLSTKSLPAPRSFTRHFFIPSLWQIGNEFVVKVLSSKSVAFAYRDEIIIFHAFLEFEDKVALVDTG